MFLECWGWVLFGDGERGFDGMGGDFCCITRIAYSIYRASVRL